MSTVERVSSGDPQQAAGDVVFVHGLGGDPYKTWQYYDRPDSFWPSWLAQDIPLLNIWTVGYEAAPSAWLGTAMPLSDRARNILDLLRLEGIGTRPLAFICHSLGGLVVKQMLRTADDATTPEASQFLQNTSALVFLATPHTGSLLANYLSKLSVIFRVSASIRDLEAYSAPLRDLNLWFRQKVAKQKIKSLVLFETQGIKISRVFRTRQVKVVDEASADPGLLDATPIGVDADHLSIAKPRNRADQIYLAVRHFIEGQFMTVRGSRSRSSYLSINTEQDGHQQSLFDKTNHRPYRFFISYRRSAELDAKLANYLRDELSRLGGEAFIDRSLTIGVDWAAEISARICWCNWFILLVSNEFNGTQAILEEVITASRRQRKYGRPAILPIHVHLTDMLEYELGTYVGGLQYETWSADEDHEKVVNALVAAVTHGPPDRLVAADALAFSRGKPPATAGQIMGGGGRPTGVLKLSDSHYIERQADHTVSSLATVMGTTLVV